MVFLLEVHLQLLTFFAFSHFRVRVQETIQLALHLTVRHLISFLFLCKPPTLLSTSWCTSLFLILTGASRVGFWGIFADQSLFKYLLHQVAVWAIGRDMTHLATVWAGQTVVFGQANCATCTTFFGVHLPS